MQCYERFHWKPCDIPNLPEWEAARLAVYFEELAAYQYEQDRKLERETNRNSGNSRSERIEEIIPAEDEDDEEWP